MSKKKILTTMSPYKLSDGGRTIIISGVDIDSSISIAREKARNISTLVISNSTIVGKDLLKFFKHVKKLKSLFIERNSIHNDTDTINLAELVVANKSLELLTLSNNDIGSSPLKTLLKNMKGSSIEDIIIEHTEDQFTKSEIEQIEQVITEVLPGVEIKITLAEDKEKQRPFINQLNEVAESKMQEQARLNKEEAAAKALAEQEAAEAARIEAERVEAEEEARIKAEQEAEAARLKAEEEARIKAEQEAEAARLKAEEEARIKAEQEAAEAARTEAERVEAERVKTEQEAAAKALAEAARIEAERVEAERVKAEQEAAAKAQAEKEAAERVEAARIEAERVEAERVKAEQEAAAKAQAEKEAAEAAEAARIKAEQEAEAALSLLEEEEALAAQSEIQDNAEFEEEVQPEQVLFTQHPSDLDYHTFPDVSAVGQPAEAESTGCCCVIS